MTPTNPAQVVGTPLTDAATYIGQAEWAEDNAPLRDCVDADFARGLERDLATERQKVVRLRAALVMYAGHLYHSCTYLGRECTCGLDEILEETK